MTAVGARGSPSAETPWRSHNFRNFWGAHAVSSLGNSVSDIALPLVGVLTLGLNGLQVGILASASALPGAFVAPFVGTIVDRLDHRRLTIALDVGCGAALAAIPLAAFLEVLSFNLLVLVGGVLSVGRQFQLVVSQVLLADVTPAPGLADANGKLQATNSVVEVGGSGIAGWLTGILGPAGTLVLDSLSFFASALLLRRIRLTGTSAESRGLKVPSSGWLKRFWADTKTGLLALWRNAVLRSMSLSYASLTLFARIQTAIYLLFLVRVEHFSATLIGLVYALSALVAIAAAVLGGGLTERFGVGRVVVMGQTAIVVGGVLLSTVAGSKLQAAGTMLLAESFFALGISLYSVASRTLLQTRTETVMRGRVIGASQVLGGLMIAIAGVVGGGLSTAVGLRGTLIVGAAGMAASLALVVRRSLWTLA